MLAGQGPLCRRQPLRFQRLQQPSEGLYVFLHRGSRDTFLLCLGLILLRQVGDGSQECVDGPAGPSRFGDKGVLCSDIFDRRKGYQDASIRPDEVLLLLSKIISVDDAAAKRV